MGTWRGATRGGWRRRWKSARGRWQWRWRWRGTSWPWPRHTPSTSTDESRRITTSDGSVGRRCSSTVGGAPYCRHHAHQYRHHGLQGWRRTRSLSHLVAFVYPQHGLKNPGDVLARPESRCLNANDAADAPRNEAACSRDSSRVFSRRPIRPPKPSGNVKRKEPKRSVENDEPRWRVASAKSTRANRSTAVSCEPI